MVCPSTWAADRWVRRSCLRYGGASMWYPPYLSPTGTNAVPRLPPRSTSPDLWAPGGRHGCPPPAVSRTSRHIRGRGFPDLPLEEGGPTMPLLRIWCRRPSAKGPCLAGSGVPVPTFPVDSKAPAALAAGHGRVPPEDMLGQTFGPPANLLDNWGVTTDLRSGGGIGDGRSVLR